MNNTESNLPNLNNEEIKNYFNEYIKKKDISKSLKEIHLYNICSNIKDYNIKKEFYKLAKYDINKAIKEASDWLYYFEGLFLHIEWEKQEYNMLEYKENNK